MNTQSCCEKSTFLKHKKHFSKYQLYGDDCNENLKNKKAFLRPAEKIESWSSKIEIAFQQVGHHPPVAAFYADTPSGDFVFRGSMYPKVKFWGKSIEFQPKVSQTEKITREINPTNPRMDDALPCCKKDH